ncbi:putative HNHc nuclease [uncultured Staphylococcus sp.]|uniref:putative HNHc nuclease n=1 Tax=uncultured Staphylococcus sp. TaxID=189668 RepID=UPI0025E9C264|nr:putative HNHc nuclease [uncultured Staphylococcus sp.]
MAIITHYTQNKGITSVFIKGIELGDKDLMLLDNGLELECEVTINDPYRITDKQRRKIFAMIRDIFEWSGQPMEYLRYMFQKQLEFLNCYEAISLKDCSRRIASELIELILDFIFTHNVPLRRQTSALMVNDKYFIYKATVSRKCVICGAQKADLAHLYTVGSGRNRKHIEHTDNKVLALCRTHHNEQHTIGIQTFNKKYHLEESWVQVDERLNKMLKGG